MKDALLLDTGPLVAYLDKRDKFYAWARDTINRQVGPMLSCEAVLTEACYLLRKIADASSTILQLVARHAVILPFAVSEETDALANLLNHYADVPMSLADACLVRMAEKLPRSKVITLDGDFLLYRKNRNQRIETLMPMLPRK
jgi:predicted nucleic acid-binding protein